MKLRDYQQDCKRKVEENWRQGIKRQMCVLATGAGKTILFAAIVQDFIARDETVLVVAHREELITQASEKLTASCGISPGIIKAGHQPIDSQIQVASIQTLARRKVYPQADLLIIDECHHAASKSYRDLIDQYPEGKVLGVTATPLRIDGYGFKDLFEDLVVGVTPRHLIVGGYLSKYKLFGGFAKLGLYTPQGRDFTAKELEKAATKLTPEDVVKCWQQFCCDKKTVVFPVNVAHSKSITDQFQKVGIHAEHIDGNTQKDERQAIIERFRKGETLVLCNCGILTEGFDCTNIEAVQCARPTTSVSLWLQMIGRALRPAPNKEYAILVDQTDNWSRLGRPDDDRNWSLAPVSADEESQGVRHCKNCHHVFKPMEALITIKTFWDATAESFKTLCRVSCPNCGLDVLWIPSEGSESQEEEAKPQDIDLDVQFKEIPAECRFEVLEQIGKLRKSGLRFKIAANRLAKFHHRLCQLIVEQRDMKSSEIQIALEILQIDKPIEKILDLALASKLRSCNGWSEVEELMNDRPLEIKRMVWDALSSWHQSRLKQLKAEMLNAA